jgi:hypothetical protein
VAAMIDRRPVGSGSRASDVPLPWQPVRALIQLAVHS